MATPPKKSKYLEMDINQFIEKFAEQLDEVEASDLSPETKFHDLEEWTPLEALCVISMASDEFGVQLTNPELKKAETIEDVYNLILTKKG